MTYLECEAIARHSLRQVQGQSEDMMVIEIATELMKAWLNGYTDCLKEHTFVYPVVTPET